MSEPAVPATLLPVVGIGGVAMLIEIAGAATGAALRKAMTAPAIATSATTPTTSGTTIQPMGVFDRGADGSGFGAAAGVRMWAWQYGQVTPGDF